MSSPHLMIVAIMAVMAVMAHQAAAIVGHSSATSAITTHRAGVVASIGVACGCCSTNPGPTGTSVLASLHA